MLKALQITPHLSSKLPDTTSWLKSEENEAGEVEQAAEVTERACGRCRVQGRLSAVGLPLP